MAINSILQKKHSLKSKRGSLYEGVDVVKKVTKPSKEKETIPSFRNFFLSLLLIIGLFEQGISRYRGFDQNQLTPTTQGLICNNLYDEEGEMSKRSVATGAHQILTWDSFGRLVNIAYLGLNNDSYTSSNIYDGLGRRIQTTFEGGLKGDTINKVNYYYDPEVEFLELGHSVNGDRTWNLFGPDRSGSYGGAQGIGGLEATYNEATGTTTQVINNFFGDTIASNAPINEAIASNATTTFTRYNAVLGGYGAMPGSILNIDLHPQWRGKYEDWTGLIYMGARYYEPVGGRFLSADPLGHEVSMDLYSYCNGDPVNGLDPDGRCVEATLNVVPGQAAWQQSIASFNNGDYGQATLSFGLMLSEQALAVATLGMSSSVSVGGEAVGSAETGTVLNEMQNIVFWAGRNGANNAAAELFAAATGAKTLAQTTEGMALDASLDYSNMSVTEIRTAWTGLSEKAAASQSGTVHSFAGGAGPDTAWKTIELPTLLRNPNVQKIIIKDATQPWRTVIKYPN